MQTLSFIVLILLVSSVIAFFSLASNPRLLPGCFGAYNTFEDLNGTESATLACHATVVFLDSHGCYFYPDGAEICMRGAPPGSIASIYDNGTMLVQFPDGQLVSCNPSNGQGPCVLGIG